MTEIYDAIKAMFGVQLEIDHANVCHHYDRDITEDSVRAVMAANPTRLQWQNPESVHCHLNDGCLYLVLLLDVPATELEPGEMPQMYETDFCFDTTDKTLHVV